MIDAMPKLKVRNLVTDASIGSEKCRCTACRGRMAPQLRDDVRSLALHNLLQTMGRFG